MKTADRESPPRAINPWMRLVLDCRLRLEASLPSWRSSCPDLSYSLYYSAYRPCRQSATEHRDRLLHALSQECAPWTPGP